MAIVEDSIDVLDSLVTALSLQSIDIVARAGSSTEAIDWLKRHPSGCDVVVIDIFLESGSGLDVLKELAALPSPPLAIVLSNYATDKLRAQCQALGAARVFDKSLDVDRMLAWMAEQAARPAPASGLPLS